MKRMPVVITKPEYVKAAAYFDGLADMRVTVCPADENAVAAAIREQEADAVILGVENYADELYTALPRGGVISRFGVGHDGIDKSKATAAGLLVTNTPGVLEDAVAEHALTLMLALYKHLPAFVRSMDALTWMPRQSLELRGKRLAIIGCGAIGRRVARIASFGFGMHVSGMDTNPLDVGELRREWGIRTLSDSFRETVENADVISLHVPAIDATRHMIRAGTLEWMPPGAMLINTSRGAVIHEESLFEALSSGQLAAAALDVFESEPYEPCDLQHDLRRLTNVLLTPHVSSGTMEACARVAAASVQNIRSAKGANWDAVSLLNRAGLGERSSPVRPVRPV